MRQREIKKGKGKVRQGKVRKEGRKGKKEWKGKGKVKERYGKTKNGVVHKAKCSKLHFWPCAPHRSSSFGAVSLT